MATIGKDKGGRKRILFVAGDGKRKVIRMGKATMQQATTLKCKVQDLITGQFTGISAETARWVADLHDDMHRRLVKVGLLEPRAKSEPGPQMSIGRLCDQFIESRTDVQKNTRNIFRHTRANLVAFFGEDKPLGEITPHDADEWRRYLSREGLAEATARKRSGVAKQIAKTAVKQRLIPSNPFEDLQSGAVGNPDRQYFVSRAETEKILEACPDTEWRLIFALCRFGGLRCPTEVLALRWQDVNWADGKILVTCQKTKRHEGKSTRWVPLFPELLPHLREAFEQAEPGATYCITRYRDRNSNLRTQLGRIAQRAGVTLWPKPFQNCRSTRESELCETFPEYVAAAWIGNSPKVARKHYLQITDEHFKRAAQNPAQSEPVLPRTDSPEAPGPEQGIAVIRAETRIGELSRVDANEDSAPGRTFPRDLSMDSPKSGIVLNDREGRFAWRNGRTSSPGGHAVLLVRSRHERGMGLQPASRLDARLRPSSIRTFLTPLP